MRRLWIGVFVLAAAVSAWWVLRGDDRPLPEFDASGPSRRDPSVQSRSSASASRRAAGPVAAAPFVDAPESAPGAEESDAPEAVEPVCAVVLRHDGEPAAHARVAVVDGENRWNVTRVAADREGRVRSPSTIAIEPSTSENRPFRKAVVAVVGLSESASPTFIPAVGEEPPAVVRLPPTVDVRVVLKRQDGSPYLGDAVVFADPAADAANEYEDRSFEAFGGQTLNRSSIVRATSGSAVFPYVACGAEIEIMAAPSAKTERPGRASLVVPSPGAEVPTVELIMGRPGVVVVGRAVDEDGGPRANTNILVQPRETSKTTAPSMFGASEPPTRTDDEGRFSTAFDFDPAEFRAVTTRIRVQHLFHDGAVIETNVTHGTPDAAGRVDLGDVVLPNAQAFCRGRVVIDGGGDDAGVVGARVGVAIRREDGSDDLTDFNWPDGSGGAMTGPDGTFELTGPPPRDAEGPLFVRASHGSYFLVEAVPLRTESSVVLRMGRGGGLTGSFHCGGAAGAAQRIEVVVSGPAVAGTRTDSVDPKDAAARLAYVGSDGGFQLTGLRPGSATVAFRARGAETPIHVVPDVAVIAGTNVEDARLKNVDLSSHFGVVRVTVRDPEGRPITDAQVSDRSNGAYEWTRRGVDSQGVALVPKIGAPAKVVVGAPGRAGCDLGRPDSDRVVVLQKAIECRVRIELPKDVEIPSAPYGLSASLQWKSESEEGDDGPWGGVEALDPEPSGSSFGADRSYVCVVRTPGTYTLALYLTRNDGNMRTAFHAGDPTTVVVSPGETKLVLEAPFDRETIAAHLKRERGD
jgi:hypothetical protein